jgi:hypothetical protein
MRPTQSTPASVAETFATALLSMPAAPLSRVRALVLTAAPFRSATGGGCSDAETWWNGSHRALFAFPIRLPDSYANRASVPPYYEYKFVRMSTSCSSAHDVLRYYLQLALCKHFRSQRRRLHVDGLPRGIWLIALPGHSARLPLDEWLQPVLDGPQF